MLNKLSRLRNSDLVADFGEKINGVTLKRKRSRFGGQA
jgi:hypothetical protein